jgi:hypothetical protein
MPGAAYRHLVDLAMHGKLKLRAPRFDPSDIKNIKFEDKDVIFNFGSTTKRFAIDELNQL